MVLCILAGNYDRLIYVGVSPWNLENICKSTNNLSFLCQFFINEITASDAGPDIIRSHLFINSNPLNPWTKNCSWQHFLYQRGCCTSVVNFAKGIALQYVKKILITGKNDYSKSAIINNYRNTQRHIKRWRTGCEPHCLKIFKSSFFKILTA